MGRLNPKFRTLATKFSKETYLYWYELMQLIRQFELMAEEKYKMEGKIRGFFHAYIGQEAIAAGCMTATKPDDIFITQKCWGAFYETALDEELKKRNVSGIVLAGISTSIGVEGTARQASERGYNIAFARDAMTDMVATAHENSLKYIFPRMGEVDDTDKIVAKLS